MEHREAIIDQEVLRGIQLSLVPYSGSRTHHPLELASLARPDRSNCRKHCVDIGKYEENALTLRRVYLTQFEQARLAQSGTVASAG
jgi:hypothetical protein